MKKVKRVKVSVRPSACFDDARIVDVRSPDGLSGVSIQVGHLNGRLQVILCRDAGKVSVLDRRAAERCQGCGAPTHASESDDLGRCGPCAERVGAPHAGVQS